MGGKKFPAGGPYAGGILAALATGGNTGDALPAPGVRIRLGHHAWLARPVSVCFEVLAVKCPFCGHLQDKVVDSREARDGDAVRRRRECLHCHRRFTTYERTDEIPYMVIKKDGRRERFDRTKVLAGLLRACEKRPVPMQKLENLVDEVEAFVADSPNRERQSTEVGELIMTRLRQLDKVAYVRFASVYLDFKDAREFMDELRHLLGERARR